MAFPNLSEIVTTTLRNRTGELADNMSRNNATLLRLTRRGNLKTFSGGRTIVQELNYADNQTFQWYSGFKELSPVHGLKPRDKGVYQRRPSSIGYTIGTKFERYF